MNSDVQIRWTGPTFWSCTACEFIGDAVVSVSAMFALGILVLLSPKAVVRILGFLLPPSRDHRDASLRAGEAMSRPG